MDNGHDDDKRRRQSETAVGHREATKKCAKPSVRAKMCIYQLIFQHEIAVVLDVVDFVGRVIYVYVSVYEKAILYCWIEVKPIKSQEN